MRNLALALPLVSLLTACGEDLTLRVPIPDVCRSLAPQQVPASPVPGITVPELTWEQAETISLGDVLPARRTGNVQLHLYVRAAELSADEAEGTLGFIRHVAVTLDATTDGALPEVELARYQKDAAAPETRAITLTTAAVDLMEYVRGDTLSVTQTFKGVPPEKATRVTPKLCVGGEAVYTVDL